MVKKISPKTRLQIFNICAVGVNTPLVVIIQTEQKQATMKKVILMNVLLIITLMTKAQYTQTIRGTVIDQILQKPIAGASVQLMGTSKGYITDSLGNFRITDIPVGNATLIITSVGYKDNAVPNITVDAGKEIILNIPMQELVKQIDAVVVSSSSKKNKPINDLSVVSARAFTVEETQKYAAAVNDPLRMATNYAGVVSADDGNNQIVIRGNSPTGLLWRMEGIDIPNPNHFAAQGSSGGGISILSAQLLSNSDFVTGAFTAEYGNALSGVFDLKLRKGNNEKREITLQAGVLGLNAAIEGPFSKNYNGSYLINYRYSTLSLLDKIGLNVGTGTTNFQDLSYNIALPTKKAGTFTVFGFNGWSNQKNDADTDSTAWKTDADRYSAKYISNTVFNGITHSINIGSNSKLNSAVGYSSSRLSYIEHFLESPKANTETFDGTNNTDKFTATTTFNHRFNRKNSLRAGVIFNTVDFNFYQITRDNITEPLIVRNDIKANTSTLQTFANWQFRASDKLTFNTGLHYLQLFYNNTSNIEPRFSAKWDLNKKNTLAVGYGRHSQAQGWGIYFAEGEKDGVKEQPNKNLGFTKADHYVLSWQHAFSKNLRLKTEAYYQQLFDVPVSTSDTNTVSTLNMENGYITDELVNKGKGRNYGLEISLEKYLDKNFYFMFSNSLYQSKYTASDGIERNTRFNGNIVSNLVAGKEFVFADGRRTLSLNIRILYAGGYRYTPIDLEQSKALGYTVYKDKEAFSLQNPAYTRGDIRISMKWNRKNFTSTLSLDVQNVTNHQNIYNQYYDITKGGLVTNYQVGIIPILNYKVEF